MEDEHVYSELDKVSNLAQENSKSIAQILISLKYLRDSVESFTTIQRAQDEKITAISNSSIQRQTKSSITDRLVFGFVQLILTTVIGAILYLVIQQ